MHLLALRISSFLAIKPDAVLKHWATAKILKSKPTSKGIGQDAELDGDEEVCKLIVDKFQQLGGADVSYADIAKRAWEVGRAGLATKVRFILYHMGRLDPLTKYISCWTMKLGRRTKFHFC